MSGCESGVTSGRLEAEGRSFGTMTDPKHLAKAIEEGDRHSREAVTKSEQEPLRLVLKRRHQWKVYSLLFVLLTELCLLMLGRTLALGPG